MNFTVTGSRILLPAVRSSRRVKPSRKITLNSNGEVNCRELARRPWLRLDLLLINWREVLDIKTFEGLQRGCIYMHLNSCTSNYLYPLWFINYRRTKKQIQHMQLFIWMHTNIERLTRHCTKLWVESIVIKYVKGTTYRCGSKYDWHSRQSVLVMRCVWNFNANSPYLMKAASWESDTELQFIWGTASVGLDSEWFMNNGKM